MNWSVCFWTSIVGAFFLTISLRMLEFFQFIKWQPIGWAKKWGIFENSHPFTKWVILFLFIVCFSMITYLISQYFKKVRPEISSIGIGLIIGVWIEWIIIEPSSYGEVFKKISVPFLVVFLIYNRFIMETAKFHREAKRLDSRNKLPYKEGMIK